MLGRRTVMTLRMNFWEYNMILLDGKKIAENILADIKKEIALLDFQPVFCDVLVGNDPASLQYVNLKKKKCESLGIKFYDARFAENISEERLIEEIKKINEIEHMCGVIVQLPLPHSVDMKKILNAIKPELDVDCLVRNFENSPTALACMHILDSLNLDLSLKKIVVLGYGNLVGMPVSFNLKKRGLQFEIVKTDTPNKESILKNADVIISGAGDPKYLKGNMIKQGAILIDAGTSESNNSIVGDVDLESVKDVAGYISPVPGGVGPVTIAMLFKNILTVAKDIHANA